VLQKNSSQSAFWDREKYRKPKLLSMPHFLKVRHPSIIFAQLSQNELVLIIFGSLEYRVLKTLQFQLRILKTTYCSFIEFLRYNSCIL